MYGYDGPGTEFWILIIFIIAFYLYVYWRIFEKAGKPGWASLIPIYNTIILLEIVGKPWWWFYSFSFL